MLCDTCDILTIDIACIYVYICNITTLYHCNADGGSTGESPFHLEVE